MQANLRRGFNRLFVVLTAVWIVYCLVVYPMQQRREAMRLYSNDVRICYENEHDEGLDKCLKSSEKLWQMSVDQWSVKNFYVGAGWLLFLIVLVPPIVVYWLCRGLTALSLWVWKGFAPANTKI